MTKGEEGHEVVVTRVLAAPPAAVWASWTQPERFRAWYGPKGHTIPSCTMDVRVGGTRVTLRATGLPPGPMSDGATMGWNEALDKLAERLAAPTGAPG